MQLMYTLWNCVDKALEKLLHCKWYVLVTIQCRGVKSSEIHSHNSF